MSELMPSSVLLHLYRVGATIVIAGDRLEVTAPDGTLTREINDVLVTRKTRLFDLLAFVDEYRTLLRRAFACGSSGFATPPEDARDLLDDQTRLIDELGPALAAQICSMTGRQWQQETSSNPWDDASGTSHGSLTNE